jgi:hypothetical protein
VDEAAESIASMDASVVGEVCAAVPDEESDQLGVVAEVHEVVAGLLGAEAWALRKVAQERSVGCGDRSIPASSRIDQTVEAATLCPRPTSSPWTRRYPHPGLSRARRTTSRRRASGFGGRPRRREG